MKPHDARVFYLVLIAAVAGCVLVVMVVCSVLREIPSLVCSRITECVLLLCALFLARRTTFVQPWFGLKVEKAASRRTLLTCLLLAAGIVALFVAARLVLQQFSAAVAARPFFRTYLDIKHRRYYWFFVLVQEVLDKWYIALPVSALVFAMLHIYHSLYYVFGAIGLALVSGVLYHRQKNVWPCFVLHFLLAFLPRCFGLK